MNAKKKQKRMKNCGLNQKFKRVHNSKKLDNYDEKYIKIEFHSDDKFPLNKTIKIHVTVLPLELFCMKVTNVIQILF